jgi:hypothetical protein
MFKKAIGHRIVDISPNLKYIPNMLINQPVFFKLC